MFSVRLLSVLLGHAAFSSLPQRPMTTTLKDFLSQIVSITFIFPILILEKEPVFSLLNVQC